jgi:hypothetical protein
VESPGRVETRESLGVISGYTCRTSQALSGVSGGDERKRKGFAILESAAKGTTTKGRHSSCKSRPKQWGCYTLLAMLECSVLFIRICGLFNHTSWQSDQLSDRNLPSCPDHVPLHVGSTFSFDEDTRCMRIYHPGPSLKNTFSSSVLSLPSAPFRLGYLPNFLITSSTQTTYISAPTLIKWQESQMARTQHRRKRLLTVFILEP